MADPTNSADIDDQGDISVTDAADRREGREPGSFGEPDERTDRQGGINQGSEATGELTPEQQAEILRRRAQGDMVDDNAASHQGGIGAQSGQADYGSSGNLAGGIAEQTR